MERIWSDMMTENRYVDRLYSVFDLPEHAEADEATSQGKTKPTRVMMFYDRSENRRTFQVLNNSLSDKDRKRIECWLRKNSQICDTINGINISGV